MLSKKNSMPNIAIIAGGNSGEHQISINSAFNILDNIDTGRYNPYLIVVEGNTWFCDIEGSRVNIDKNDFTLRHRGNTISFQCVFIIVHGTPGEDGMLQGYFDLLGIPYTTSGRLTSALTFSKYTCSRFVSVAGCINIADSVLIRRGADIDEEDVLGITGLPCFVKPNKGGSSVGMSKVKVINELLPSIEKAFGQDDEVLIEAFVRGTEVTCGVCTINGQIVVLPLTEIVPKTDYFDYEAKYLGKSEEITPARISDEDTTEVKRVSSLLYRHLNCKGFVRFDYILGEKGLFFLEVNTVPGMSKESIIPQMLQHHGMTIKQFISEIIDEAII